MSERRHAKASPAGLELRVEVQWCMQCHAECAVQIVQLVNDPEPVALCVECGAGVDLWLSADVVEPPLLAAWAGAGTARPLSRRQGAA